MTQCRFVPHSGLIALLQSYGLLPTQNSQKYKGNVTLSVLRVSGH